MIDNKLEKVIRHGLKTIGLAQNQLRPLFETKALNYEEEKVTTDVEISLDCAWSKLDDLKKGKT